MHFCTVNKAKYKIAPTSNEGYTNIVLEEKYDFPNYQLGKASKKKSAKLWTLSKQGGGGVRRSDEMSKPS